MRRFHAPARWIATACLLGLLAQPAPADDAKKDDTKAGFDSIAVSSSGGFTGRGSGKTFSVDAKGKYTAGAAGKQKQGDLKAEELEQLKKLVAAVDWKAIKESYRGMGADFFQDDLTVTVGGKKHLTHVTEDADRKALPAALKELLEYQDKLYKQYKP